jgi:hypothetical protein
MNTYYFLTAPRSAPDVNAGSHFISDGIKALVQMADPTAILQDITLFAYNERHWSTVLFSAKGIFLCGNPRFDPSETDFFWLRDLQEHMLKAQDLGIKIGDLFLGAAATWPGRSIAITAKKLLEGKRNKATLETLKRFDMVVTRDEISHVICNDSIKDEMLLLDSTFWARNFYNISTENKEYNCVTLPCLNCEPWLIRSLYKIKDSLSKERKTYFLCHADTEYWLAKEVISDIRDLIIIYDPVALLKFYAKTDKLVSCRLHGSIPALSLGAKVANIAVDSRALAFDLFGGHSTLYKDLKDYNPPLQFYELTGDRRASSEFFVELFKAKIMR